MDNKVLKNIENDNENEINVNVDQKTLNSFINEWSICDIFNTDENNAKTQYFDNNEEKKEKKSSEIIQNTLNFSQNEINTHWQDNTFLDKMFSQFDSYDQKKNVLECSTQVIHTSKNSEKYSEKTHVTEGMNSIHLLKNKQQDVKFLKRYSDTVNYNNIIPNKICCLDNELKEQNININTNLNNDTFYGLSNKIKELFLKIRGINTLYQWQDDCLNLDAIKNRKNLIYALPTSGGKTLVAEILMLQELTCNKKNAIFILPFVAIVQEKIQAMTPFALELGFLVEEYAATKGTFPPKKRRKKNSIYICTIEKALGLINSLIEEKRLHEIGIIVVDELHLLGENGGRGATLEVLLTKVLYINDNIHIIGMSATIGNLEEIATFLNADLYTGNFRPIEIKEYVKCDENIWLVDLKTEELLTDVKKINYRYSKDAAIIDPDRIAGLVMDIIPEHSCLIFCSSRKNCENVALLLTKVLPKSLQDYKRDKKQNLLNALKNEEGLCPILNKTINFGVVYHHSGLTSEERRLLEDAFKIGTLCVICCTSTLATGINLPARRVILRSPYIGNQFLNLSRYKQMVGRAGRAGMGNIGESILICKNNELQKITELLKSKMDDSLSTLHIDKDRGINNLILSAILFSMATTRYELHKIVKKTLLNIQQKRLNVNIKQIVDETITDFLKSGIIKIKEKERNVNILKPNVSVMFPSQEISSSPTTIETKKKRIIKLTNNSKLELCSLGRAAMKGCIDMECAYTLYQDLKKAQEHLILLDYLHLLYLVTPYNIISQIKPIGFIYYDMIIKLSETQMKTARLLGINEVNISKIRDGLMPKLFHT
ncbi:helicase POLQ-like isoform X4 [Apis cerana]|uniref:helicase POLQ-like isoform X4 n=1 Tax=Apis cerana TaxID=7461 RepID=UPI002B23DDFB|nr:helicase POLQ-like isoform X4 [Apis cerana]